MSASTELQGMVAIVTGGGINTGSVIARTLAGAGASVVVNYRASEVGALETVREIEAAGGKAFSWQADVCDSDAVLRMVEETIKQFGPPDILVNNANVRDYRSLMDVTIEEFRRTVTPTLEGALNCIKACVPHMRRVGSGAIINIGGGSGHTGVPNRVHVSAAKAGIAGMTGALAVELAPDQISVNNIVPGRIETPRPDHVVNEVKGREASPMGRNCQQSEIAELVLFLASRRCRYMSGQMLHVNGARYVTIA